MTNPIFIHHENGFAYEIVRQMNIHEGDKVTFPAQSPGRYIILRQVTGDKPPTLADVERVAQEKGWDFEVWKVKWFLLTQCGKKPNNYRKYIKRRYRGLQDNAADLCRGIAVMGIEEDA